MFATLPISYCTNVHPGLTVAEVIDRLREYTGPLNKRVGPIAAGLWLAETVVQELAGSSARESFAATLRDLDLVCYTLNAFPQGDFHSESVKEAVYRPDWSTNERLGLHKELRSDSGRDHAGRPRWQPFDCSPRLQGAQR